MLFPGPSSQCRQVQKPILHVYKTRFEPSELPASQGRNRGGILFLHQQPVHTVDSVHTSPLVVTIVSIGCCDILINTQVVLFLIKTVYLVSFFKHVVFVGEMDNPVCCVVSG